MMCSLGLWVVLWPVLFCSGQAVPKGLFPPPTRYVADYADVIEASQEDELNGLLQSLEMRTGVPYIIMTVQTVKKDSISRFAKRTAVFWKLRREGNDKGVLFVMIPKEKAYCFEVGYDMRAVLTKEVLGQVEEDIKPCLQAGKVSEGIYKSNVRVIRRIADQNGVTIHRSLQPLSPGLSDHLPWQEKDTRSGWIGWSVVIGILVSVGVIWGRQRSKRRPERSVFSSYGFGPWCNIGRIGLGHGGCFGGGFGAFGVFNGLHKKDLQTKDVVSSK